VPHSKERKKEKNTSDMKCT